MSVWTTIAKLKVSQGVAKEQSALPEIDQAEACCAVSLPEVLVVSGAAQSCSETHVLDFDKRALAIVT